MPIWEVPEPVPDPTTSEAEVSEDSRVQVVASIVNHGSVVSVFVAAMPKRSLEFNPKNTDPSVLVMPMAVLLPRPVRVSCSGRLLVVETVIAPDASVPVKLAALEIVWPLYVPPVMGRAEEKVIVPPAARVMDSRVSINAPASSYACIPKLLPAFAPDSALLLPIISQRGDPAVRHANTRLVAAAPLILTVVAVEALAPKVAVPVAPCTREAVVPFVVRVEVTTSVLGNVYAPAPNVPAVTKDA